MVTFKSFWYLTTGDFFSHGDGIQFSTFDKDNDRDTNLNCAVTSHGAWWYRDCHGSNLNGLYKVTFDKGSDGIIWNGEPMKQVAMKIRQ